MLFGSAHIREAEQLRNRYTGKLQDAESSKPEDKESIQAEISASGVAKDVDDAIQVLLHAGMSTPMLQLAVSSWLIAPCWPCELVDDLPCLGHLDLPFLEWHLHNL